MVYINHEILLKKLEHYGVRGLPLKWFESYLHNRKQFVEYKNTSSSNMNVNCGVPQGSVLGPLLFIIYTNDLPEAVKVCKTILFADDTTIYLTGKNKRQLFSDMKNDLDCLIDWFRANKLSLNILKTNYVFFKPSQVKIYDDTINEDLSLKFGNEVIEKKDHVVFLGLNIDQNLSWSYQIDDVLNKLAKSSYMMNSVKKFLPNEAKLLLYYSFLYSQLTEGILLWGPSRVQV